MVDLVGVAVEKAGAGHGLRGDQRGRDHGDEAVRDGAIDGQVEQARCNGSIIMYDQTLKEVARWEFQRAWPSKVSGPTPKSDGNEVGLEELTIAHEYIKRVK